MAKKVVRVSNSPQVVDMPSDDVADLVGGLLECVSSDVEFRLASRDPITVVEDHTSHRSQQRRDDLPEIDPVFRRRSFEQKTPDNMLGWRNYQHVLAQEDPGQFLLNQLEQPFRSAHLTAGPLTACSS